MLIIFDLKLEWKWKIPKDADVASRGRKLRRVEEGMNESLCSTLFQRLSECLNYKTRVVANGFDSVPQDIVAHGKISIFHTVKM